MNTNSKIDEESKSNEESKINEDVIKNEVSKSNEDGIKNEESKSNEKSKSSEEGENNKESKSNEEDETFAKFFDIRQTTFECVQCCAIFNTNIVFYNHLCAGKRSVGYPCDICEKILKDAHNYQKHVKDHLDY
ncbi:hypothetical protein TNCV_4779311 [Trichonephila clavipes]|nr:hypothetical protein TNCV_4779311 [Trichonephila clavipes]